MPDSDIKFRVSQEGAEKVSQDFKKVDGSINQMEDGSIKATKGIGNLGTVGRQVGSSIASSAGLNGGIARVIGSFMGGGGLIFALGAVGIALYGLIKDANDAAKAFERFVGSIDGAIKKLIEFEDPLKGVKFGIKPEQIDSLIKQFDAQIKGYEEGKRIILQSAGISAYGVNVSTLLGELGILKGLTVEQQKQLALNEKLKEIFEDKKASLEAQQKISEMMNKLGVEELETEKKISKVLKEKSLIMAQAKGEGAARFIPYAGDATRRRGDIGAGQAMISRELQNEMKQMQTLIGITAGVLRDEFTQAWEDVFGEANSLFEKFAMRIAEYFTELALRQAAMGLFNLIFPGAGTVAGMATSAVSGGATLDKSINIILDGEVVGTFIDNRVPYSVSKAVRLDII